MKMGIRFVRLILTIIPEVPRSYCIYLLSTVDLLTANKFVLPILFKDGYEKELTRLLLTNSKTE